MKMNLGIKARIALPLIGTLILGMSALAVYNYVAQVSIMNDQADQSIKSAINGAQSLINDHLSLYQQMSVLVANSPIVADALSKGDRSKLIAEYLSGYEALKKRIKLNQFNFHRPPGITLLRLQDLERYGDNLAAVRHTIADVNEKRAGVRGIEFGRTGLGLRGVEPVFSRGSYVGSLEFGGDLTPALDEAKRAFGDDFGVVISKEATAVSQVLPEWQKAAKPIGGYLSFYTTKQELTQALVNADLIVQAKKAGTKTFVGEASYGGRDYFVGFAPLKDYSGVAIGYLYVLKDKTALSRQITKTLVINLLAYILIIVFVAAAIGYGMTRNVIDPVIALTKAADNISMGKLSDKVEIKGVKGELATLAKSIDRMRASMKKLLE